MSAELPEYLNADDVAELARTSVNTVRYWRQIGTGPKGFKLGRRVLYSRDDVLAWIESAKAADA